MIAALFAAMMPTTDIAVWSWVDYVSVFSMGIGVLIGIMALAFGVVALLMWVERKFRSQ